MSQLKANNITTSEFTGFTKTGQTFKALRVTFFVGPHGPFTKDFPSQSDQTQAIQQYIDSVVSQQNALQQRYA